ncbi:MULTISPECIES: HEPN domain-containing protein [unclassified Sphingobium]|uniref:HEPN domain-containing protein n=1 Tax=unclassified Sphingobium TaxID=2611147 RepID=UPI000C50D1C8|nr:MULTISPECIES: HEPN domain-containing protein [unclassified Sphingobium]MBS89669.1 nucleotidyltransferase [Sphingobium sp.]
MKTELDHLPANKRRDLDRIVRILFEEFEDALGEPTGPRKLGRILKVILFGSYATGGWVDEPYTKRGYQSDYDLLIIVNQKELTDRIEYWEKAADRLDREWSILHRLTAPVNFIVHTLQEVNDGLAHGRYFFMDIARDGIALYQVDNSELHEPRPKTPQQAYDMAKAYFDQWFELAVSSRMGFQFFYDNKQFPDAAYNLQQACERLYYCVLLVYTFYTPYSHNLKFLRTRAEKISARLVEAWPRETRKQEAYFNKLKDAYVKARHSEHFKMTEEEFAYLSERVEVLGTIVNELCQERLSELRAPL